MSGFKRYIHVHASCIGPPLIPKKSLYVCPKKIRSSFTNSATSLSISPTLSTISSVAMTWCVTSRPNTARGIPLVNTTSAASASTKILNSAAGVQLPNVPPPINTISSILFLIEGSLINAIAILVNGPVGTRVTFSFEFLTVSIIKSTACNTSSCRFGSGKIGPSIPESPWISVAISISFTSGRDCPL